jgi:tripartite-type tricarboxylate transporter receptor subunit TctC
MMWGNGRPLDPVKRHMTEMKMKNGKLVLAVAAVIASTGAGAQEYPTRTITMVVPLAAGGSADVVGRLLAQSMSEHLGRTVIVENVVGAGGMVGASKVAKAAPDGYQILLGTVGTQAQNQTLYKTPLYDSTKDFEAVGLAVDVPIILQTTKDFPGDRLPDVVSNIKANAAKLSYGSPGAGSSNHLACVLFNAAIGADVTHIPYRASGELFQDMITGRLDYWCPTTTAAATLGDKVKTIVTFSRERLATLPDVPTARESGLKDFEAGTWFGLFLPRGAPSGIRQKLNEALGKALDSPAVLAKLRETGVTAVSRDRRSPAYLSEYVATQVKKWEGPIKASGVSM